MYLLIDGDRVDNLWGLLEPGLKRATFDDDLGSVYSLSDIYSSIKAGNSHAFYDTESQYAGILSLRSFPKKKMLYVYWGGQNPECHSTPDYEQMDAFLVKVAKAFGASVIMVEGRRGWERKVKHLGYVPETVNLYKEVPL